MQGNSSFDTLVVEMGCNPILTEAAIRQLKTQDLSALLDWISEHSEQQAKWSEWLKQNQNSNGSQAVNQGESQSIEHLINKQMRDQLIKKGHSKNVAEKSLLLTNSVSVQSCEKWIEEHRYDPDFQQQLRLTGQANNPKLTPEQAKQKLKQLTDKARQVRKKRQEQQERQRQKNRVRYGKQMIQAKRIAEQQAVKRQLQLDRIQKQKDQDYKKKLLEQMKRERNAKLGIKQEDEVKQGQTIAKKKQQPKLSKLQQFQVQCQQVKVGMHAYPDRAKTFFQTAHIYVNNIIKNNGQQKYRKINKENKAFQSRIVQCFGGQQALKVIGYEEAQGFLILKKFDINELKNISSILERYQNYY